MVFEKLKAEVGQLEANLKKKRQQKELARQRKETTELTRLSKEQDKLLADLKNRRTAVDRAKQIKEAKKEIKKLRGEVHPSTLQRFGKALVTTERGLVKGGKFAAKAAKETNKILDDLSLEKRHVKRRKKSTAFEVSRRQRKKIRELI